jgi:hypothetical protein
MHQIIVQYFAKNFTIITSIKLCHYNMMIVTSSNKYQINDIYAQCCNILNVTYYIHSIYSMCDFKSNTKYPIELLQQFEKCLSDHKITQDGEYFFEGEKTKLRMATISVKNNKFYGSIFANEFDVTYF